MGFDARIDLRESADRAGNGASGDLLARGNEALAALYSKARRLSAASSASRSAIKMSAARTSWTLKQVSSTSDDVMPECM
jgi:hypothetical protein